MGGENPTVARPDPRDAGSSPRGRGKPAFKIAGGDLSGLIPAWAGKTWSCGQTASHAAAHPRVGGENEDAGPVGARVSGSSPRGRGKRCRRDQEFQPSMAHPRVGGENVAGAVCGWCGGGSSPRGRGKPTQAFCLTTLTGLIPAWAGKTRRNCVCSRMKRAHPRVGGEN